MYARITNEQTQSKTGVALDVRKFIEFFKGKQKEFDKTNTDKIFEPALN